MASFLPPSKQQQGFTTNPPRGYESKKINGALPPPGVGSGGPTQQQTSPSQQQLAMKVRPTSGQPPPPQAPDMNGIAGISDVLNTGNGNGGQSGGQNFSGIYNDSDNYLPTVVAPGGGREMSNGLYGQHELVAAISQITAEPPNVGPTAAQQQNKAFNKAKKLWSETGGGSSENAGGSGNAGVNKPNDTETTKGPRGFGGGRPPSGGRSGRYSGGQNNEMNLPGGGGNDGASDSLSSASEEVGATSSVTSATAPMQGEIGDNGKPLSFARIASLNLEKQALQRAAAGKGGAGGTTTSAAGGPNPTDLGNLGNPNPVMVMEQMKAAAASAAAMNANPAAVTAAMNANTGLAVAAASMANMSMAEAAAAAAAQQGMHAPYSNHPMAAMAMAAQAAQQQQNMPMIQLPPSNNPRFYFDIAMDGKRLGRAIIEVQASLAPKMAQNFHLLVTSEKGFGYRGCQFFQAWRNESVICGDWEHNSGRGGRAAIDDGPLFTPDETKLPCIRGAVGMRRMSKKHSSLNQVRKKIHGIQNMFIFILLLQVASQFRVILANMNTQFTGIFGHVVSGIEALDKVADIGGEGGRPEKIAMVTHCGIYKG